MLQFQPQIQLQKINIEDIMIEQQEQQSRRSPRIRSTQKTKYKDFVC